MSDQFRNAFALSEMPEIRVPEHGVIAVVLAYNEGFRLPYFLEFYRKIGVTKFIVVDNNSSDDTGNLLRTQPDVHVITTAQPYSQYKSTWRQLICDEFLEGKWVLFPDLDELLVYPGWPDRSINELVSSLSANGCQALFTTMVDMYPKGGLKHVRYCVGDSFFGHGAYFDGGGYRYCPLKGSHGKRYKTPARHVFGGTRERLFHSDAKRKKNLLDRLLLMTLFSLSSTAPKTRVGRKFDQLLFKLVKNTLPMPAPVQSKIPLIKWQKGTTFSGGVHSVVQDLKIATEWGTLLHFKYLDDFQSKVTEALDRKQHTDQSGHYLDYDKQMDILLEEGLYRTASLKFEGVKSLIDSGLMRK